MDKERNRLFQYVNGFSRKNRWEQGRKMDNGNGKFDFLKTLATGKCDKCNEGVYYKAREEGLELCYMHRKMELGLIDKNLNNYPYKDALNRGEDWIDWSGEYMDGVEMNSDLRGGYWYGDGFLEFLYRKSL